MTHIPVLSKEVISLLRLGPNQNFIDCTLGTAGHTLQLLQETRPNGRTLGIERDPEQAKKAREVISKAGFASRVTIAQDTFANIAEIARRERFRAVHAILFDLGFSSEQLGSGRGLSFSKSEPLDMRYDPSTQTTAAKILNYQSRHELERILKEYGEERYARQIAEAIVKARPLHTTFQLRELIEKTVPGKHQPIHPATRTFQALRIAVNEELDHLRAALPQAAETLAPGGRLAVISFHSLEDRIVKEFFRDEETLNIVTKKPVTASVQEIQTNRSSRSAKLRVAEKTL
ncbi:MAG: 16S rRNA (cytosine(1402)-N(4))-methyltransferase RsmH [bacterium]|nr:16S rRNA (cytosine(1402)-N(4))-methyltransferase RsmH [bacterium]